MATASEVERLERCLSEHPPRYVSPYAASASCGHLVLIEMTPDLPPHPLGGRWSLEVTVRARDWVCRDCGGNIRNPHHAEQLHFKDGRVGGNGSRSRITQVRSRRAKTQAVRS